VIETHSIYDNLIDQMRLKSVNGPQPVQDPFNEVNQAHRQRANLNEARRDYGDVIHLAEGENNQRISGVPEVTRRCFCIETPERVTPRVRSNKFLDKQTRTAQ
jgi:membrane protease subunit HflK